MAAKEFGEKLKELRSKAHTQLQLGNILGVGEKQIQRYEAGELLPDHEKVKTLIDLYQYDFLRLIYDVPREISHKVAPDSTDYKAKYIALLEKQVEQKDEMINVSLSGLIVGQKSVLAHLAVGLEFDALREASGDQKKARQIKDNMDRRISEVLVGDLKKSSVSGGRSGTGG